MESVESIVAALHARRQALLDTCPPDMHRHIGRTVQNAAAAVGAVAETLPLLFDEAARYLDRKRLGAVDENVGKVLQQSKTVRNSTGGGLHPVIEEAQRIDQTIALHLTHVGLFALAAAAEALATEKDSEAVRHLQKQIGAAAVTWGSKLSPVRYQDVVDAINLLKDIKDLTDLTQAKKYRHAQAAVGSAYLEWVDAVYHIAFLWCFAAEGFLLALAGRGSASEDEQYDRVYQRILGVRHAAVIE